MDDLEQELELNNNLYWLLRYGFYGAVVGDILKAASGGACVGTFTLCVCGISALAELEWCNKKQ